MIHNPAQELAIVAAVNDEASLAHNLMRSDLIAVDGVPVHVERGATCASMAYNRGLDATDAPYVVFVHQDVYFPPGFKAALERAIMQVDRIDPDWGLIAPFGIARDTVVHRGDIWTTSLNRRVGEKVVQPIAAQSFDELAFIMRRDAGLRFDEKLPSWHLYGTDIVQTAWVAGKGAYIADLPVVHNDGFHGVLGADFTAGYTYTRCKWRRALPLRTPVVRLRWHGMDLPIYRLRAARSIERRRALAGDTGTDPRIFSATCGWEDVPA